MYTWLDVKFYINPPAGFCVLISSYIFFFGSVASIFLLYSNTIFQSVVYFSYFKILIFVIFTAFVNYILFRPICERFHLGLSHPLYVHIVCVCVYIYIYIYIYIADVI